MCEADGSWRRDHSGRSAFEEAKTDLVFERLYMRRGGRLGDAQQPRRLGESADPENDEESSQVLQIVKCHHSPFSLVKARQREPGKLMSRARNAGDANVSSMTTLCQRPLPTVPMERRPVVGSTKAGRASERLRCPDCGDVMRAMRAGWECPRCGWIEIAPAEPSGSPAYGYLV